MFRAVAPPLRLCLNLNTCPRTITSLLLPQFRTAHSSHKRRPKSKSKPKQAVPRRAAEPMTIPPPVLLSAHESGASPLSPSTAQALINDYAGRTTSRPSESLGEKFCSGLFLQLPPSLPPRAE